MTPEQEEAVRRALASEGSPGPMPRELADRLDATLAKLASERSRQSGEPTGERPTGQPTAGRADRSSVSPASELSMARRRRWPRLLVAAASVAVLGVGIGSLRDDMRSGSADSAAGGIAAEDAPAPEGSTRDHARKGADGQLPESAPLPSLTRQQADELRDGDLRLSLQQRPARLRSDSLALDVLRVRDRAAQDYALSEDADDPGDAASGSNLDTAARLVFACTLPATDRGDLIAAVRLDGERGTLVLHKTLAGDRVAEVYACADPGRLLASTSADE
ncbi:MAG: hypothetical protein H0V42_07330 [Nocardioidaceae bacterium]|nr:hypothetical protein [Nocardioidaceae bacterium]